MLSTLSNKFSITSDIILLKPLKEIEKPKGNFTLVFGNEATGLSDDYLNENAVRIEQSDEVDSLNLATAVVVALYYLK